MAHYRATSKALRTERASLRALRHAEKCERKAYAAFRAVFFGDARAIPRITGAHRAARKALRALGNAVTRLGR